MSARVPTFFSWSDFRQCFTYIQYHRMKNICRRGYDNSDKEPSLRGQEDCNNIRDQYRFYKFLFLHTSGTSFHLNCCLSCSTLTNCCLTKKNLMMRNYCHHYSSSSDKPVPSQYGTAPVSDLGDIAWRPDILAALGSIPAALHSEGQVDSPYSYCGRNRQALLDSRPFHSHPCPLRPVPFLARMLRCRTRMSKQTRTI